MAISTTFDDARTWVAEGGSCYLQIMSSDTPLFQSPDKPIGEQMKAALPAASPSSVFADDP
jgi:hypothetical protein